MKKKRGLKYKNTMLLILSVLVLLVAADTEVAHSLIRQIGSYGYAGAFVTGIFFVSTFTVAPASLVLYHLSQDFSPVLVALSAGAGAALGDLMLFRFLKDRVFDEVAPLLRGVKKSYVFTAFRSRKFAWLLPIIGAMIIASPFPDEIGIALMGLSRIRLWQLMPLVFILNSVGIFIIVSVIAAI